MGRRPMLVMGLRPLMRMMRRTSERRLAPRCVVCVRSAYGCSTCLASGGAGTYGAQPQLAPCEVLSAAPGWCVWCGLGWPLVFLGLVLVAGVFGFACCRRTLVLLGPRPFCCALHFHVPDPVVVRHLLYVARSCCAVWLSVAEVGRHLLTDLSVADGLLHDVCILFVASSGAFATPTLCGHHPVSAGGGGPGTTWLSVMLPALCPQRPAQIRARRFRIHEEEEEGEKVGGGGAVPSANDPPE